MSAAALSLEIADRTWRVLLPGHDLSIPLRFDAAQPNFFGVPPATADVVRAGSFVGDVRQGGSCNCATYTVTPHCNGTHTECVGHVTAEPDSVRDRITAALMPALLVTVVPTLASTTPETSDPAPLDSDLLITRTALAAAVEGGALDLCRALIVRTEPNDPSKLQRQYGPQEPPPFFSAEAMQWIVTAGIEHLVVDVPSLDRAEDGGKLTAHRIFWGMAPGARSASVARRPHASITELAYIDAAIADGMYLLNLQIAPFVADAAPSRPILLPLAS